MKDVEVIIIDERNPKYSITLDENSEVDETRILNNSAILPSHLKVNGFFNYLFDVSYQTEKLK
ncbi:hypothetical protein ABEI56_05570 [Peribacillus castrilensis]|uniref:hypothetical protein n=1 Tax=Peribacillus castrilensis TaxID=2897690 RepID=UPI003D28AA07